MERIKLDVEYISVEPDTYDNPGGEFVCCEDTFIIEYDPEDEEDLENKIYDYLEGDMDDWAIIRVYKGKEMIYEHDSRG